MTTMNMPGGGHNFNHYGVLRFFWDGEQTPSVEVPFGDFFGVPWGKYTHYTAEPLSCTSGGYNCNFLMPFASGCRIEAVNQSSEPWPALFFQIQYLEMAEQPSPLRFHAQWRRQNPTKQRVPYRVLEAQGTGNFAGMHLFMQNAEWWLNPRRMVRRAKETGTPFGAFFPEMVGMGMLEGWERIYVDDEPVPSITGTGTEDYFNSGFLFFERHLLRSLLGLYRSRLPDFALRRLPLPHSRSHSLPALAGGGYGPRVYQSGSGRLYLGGLLVPV
jgi:hypothetical protein